jgi:hypothetical protein
MPRLDDVGESARGRNAEDLTSTDPKTPSLRILINPPARLSFEEIGVDSLCSIAAPQGVESCVVACLSDGH